jgi:5-(carboxyamino)imidazole ribonucleotide mutase
MTNPVVGILMGSDSDLGVMRDAARVLSDYAIDSELRVLSAHRVPAEVASYAATAEDRGVRVIIAGAGMAAHLAGVVAAHTALPVIGVPLLSERTGLAGSDALFATVQMPPGVPVATVGIGAAKNAGHLAARILALSDRDVAARVNQHRTRLQEEVLAKDARLQELGADGYLASTTRV